MKLTDEQQNLYTEICDLIEEKLGRRTNTLSNSIFAMVWNRECALKDEVKQLRHDQRIERDLLNTAQCKTDEYKHKLNQAVEVLREIAETSDCKWSVDRARNILTNLSEEWR